MSIKKLGKKSACFLLAGTLLVGGNCVPKRFWVNTWGTVLSGATNQVAGHVVDIYVVDPLIEAVDPPADPDAD